MRILFAPMGSEGDVNPLLWLAGELTTRGHHAIFLLTPHYARLAEKHGFAWIPVGTEEDFRLFANDPRLWSANGGPHFVLRGMTRTLTACQEAFERVELPIDLVITSTLGAAAGTMAEARKIPRLILHMQPTCFLSETDTPLFREGMAWLIRAPRWVKRIFYRLVDFVLWNIALKPLNAFRREHGLKPLSHFYREALFGAEGVAALFPDWFAPAQPDWPANVRQFGFPLSREAIHPLSPELEEFLSHGEAPIVWTHGSANFDIREFHRCAIGATELLKSRALLVSLAPPAQPLPPHILHVSHVAFEDLFPRCRAVVHHGGIGTTAKAVAAGIPQLIIPRSHDQPDNAYRIARLKLGASLSYKKLQPKTAAAILRELISSPAVQAACRTWQARLRQENPGPALCDWAEELAARKSSE